MNEHLTDDQIQDYLEGNPSSNQAEILAHLVTCRQCRMAVADSQAIFDGLRNEAGFELSPGFAASVTRQVAPATKASSPVPEYLLIGGAIAAVACALYFLVDLTPLMELIKSGFARRPAIENTFTSTISEVLGLLNIKSNMVLITGGALLVLGLLDRAVRSLKRGRLYFFV